jgi:CheY-like chemotaxis protein
LKSIGYTIVSFVNPVEALDYFNKNFADCSLVITDYGMPQMSGIDLIKKIREKDQNYTKKKIILISATIKGNILKDYYDELSNLEVNKILEKPMSEILKNEIKVILIK